MSATEKRTSWRRIGALATIWGAISAAALIAPGCYGRNCEGGVENFGAEPGQGGMIDENTWESSPMDGTWLWFPRQRVYFFDIPPLGGRVPKLVVPYVAASPQPQINGGNFTVGAGNIALLSGVRANHVDIRNDTCSDYYLRLVLLVEPLPPAVPGDDGGADGGIPDASADEDADADSGP
ncbi:MAG: hypothetical protein K0S65_265 [Labilithrix sp.]|jgi:hypothetical protein|nr:hypothetical protein [Labilithrix sp.]